MSSKHCVGPSWCLQPDAGSAHRGCLSWHVFQCRCLALELTRRGPQCLLSCCAATSTALVTMVQLLEKQSCEHHCNPAAPTSTAPALQPGCGTAEQAPALALLVSCPTQPLASDFPTYLCHEPLPGLQAAGSSSTKQSMVRWSARTATSMSLQSLALLRHRASLQAQEGTCHQVLARASILPPLIPNSKHTVAFSSWTHTCACICSERVSGCPRCAAGISPHGVQSGVHTYPGTCCTCTPCLGLRRVGR